MSSLFNDQALEKIKKIRTVALRLFVGILIAEIIVWAIIIITKQSDITVSKFQGTFLIIAGALFVSILNFRSLEKGKSSAQLMAIISLVACALWTLLLILVVWGVISVYEPGSSLFHTKISGIGRFISVVSTTMMCTMLAACAARVEENGSSIKPLKWTAFISIICVWVIVMILTFMDTDYYSGSDFVTTLLSLAGLASLSFFVTGIAASVISKSNRKDNSIVLIA